MITVLALGSLVVDFQEVSGASTSINTCVQSELSVKYANFRAGTGNVNLIFTVRNGSSRSCSLRGFPRSTFFGPSKKQLTVIQSNLAHRDGNDLGGLKPGFAFPTVVLPARGFASFAIYGRDMPHGNSNNGCVTTKSMRVSLPSVVGNFTVSSVNTWCGGITMHPIVSGQTGVDPPNSSL